MKVHQGEIYSVDLGGPKPNPALIVQNEIGNRTSDTTIVVPLLESSKIPKKKHVNCGKYEADIEQLRTVDKTRLRKRIGRVSQEALKEVMKAIHESVKFNKLDVFWVSLYDTVGHEQRGFRPCVTLKNTGGGNPSSCLIIPLTTRKKKNLPTHFQFRSFGKEQTACADQIRCVDTWRLKNKLGTLDRANCQGIQRCFNAALKVG